MPLSPQRVDPFGCGEPGVQPRGCPVLCERLGGLPELLQGHGELEMRWSEVRFDPRNVDANRPLSWTAPADPGRFPATPDLKTFGRIGELLEQKAQTARNEPLHPRGGIWTVPSLGGTFRRRSGPKSINVGLTDFSLERQTVALQTACDQDYCWGAYQEWYERRHDTWDDCYWDRRMGYEAQYYQEQRCPQRTGTLADCHQNLRDCREDGIDAKMKQSAEHPRIVHSVPGSQ